MLSPLDRRIPCPSKSMAVKICGQEHDSQRLSAGASTLFECVKWNPGKQFVATMIMARTRSCTRDSKKEEMVGRVMHCTVTFAQVEYLRRSPGPVHARVHRVLKLTQGAYYGRQLEWNNGLDTTCQFKTMSCCRSIPLPTPGPTAE